MFVDDKHSSKKRRQNVYNLGVNVVYKKLDNLWLKYVYHNTVEQTQKHVCTLCTWENK